VARGVTSRPLADRQAAAPPGTALGDSGEVAAEDRDLGGDGGCLVGTTDAVYSSTARARSATSAWTTRATSASVSARGATSFAVPTTGSVGSWPRVSGSGGASALAIAASVWRRAAIAGRSRSFIA
jgi:hypothetical protein